MQMRPLLAQEQAFMSQIEHDLHSFGLGCTLSNVKPSSYLFFREAKAVRHHGHHINDLVL